LAIVGTGRQPEAERGLDAWTLPLPQQPAAAWAPVDGEAARLAPGAPSSATDPDGRPARVAATGSERSGPAIAMRRKDWKKLGKKARKRLRKALERERRSRRDRPVAPPSPGAAPSAPGVDPAPAPPPAAATSTDGDRDELPDEEPADHPSARVMPGGTDDDRARDPNRIGIVFVPGFGRRLPGETLLAWSTPILRLLTAWAATTHGVRPQNDLTQAANADVSGATRPFVAASVPAVGDHPAQTWLMTEAWWAAQMRPPSVGSMIRWLVPGQLVRLWTGTVSGIAGRDADLFKLLDIVLLPLLLVPAAVLVLLAASLLRLVRVIPWRPLRELAMARTAELFLVRWLGDASLLLADRVQGAGIRAGVADAIRDCETAGCGTVVLVAHGSGAIVGYATLADETYASLPVSRFITHGQALGIAWRLGHADEYDVPDRRPDRLYRGDRLRANLARLPFRAGLRWHDFRATHDPAPGGGLSAGPRVTTPELVGGTSTRVFNRMSLSADHDAYWDNDEEFVLPVARLIDLSPSGPARPSRFFPEGRATSRVARRRHRVRVRQFARSLVLLAALAAAVVAIVDPLATGGRTGIARAGDGAWNAFAELIDAVRPTLAAAGVDLSPGPLDRVASTLLGGVLVLAAYVAVGGTLARLWAAWDARERRIALQPLPAWRSLLPLAAQLGLCAAAAAWLISVPATGDWVFAAPSAAAVLAALVVAALTGRGSVRRPPAEELRFEDVAP